MPKHTDYIAKAKARRLTKLYAQKGLNQAAVAREEGVSRQAINQRIHKDAVIKTMSEILDRAGITDDFLAEKLKEGINAVECRFVKKGKKFVLKNIKDFGTRHKYVVTALEVKKHIRTEEGDKQLVVHLDFGHRKKKEAEAPK